VHPNRGGGVTPGIVQEVGEDLGHADRVDGGLFIGEVAHLQRHVQLRSEHPSTVHLRLAQGDDVALPRFGGAALVDSGQSQ